MSVVDDLLVETRTEDLRVQCSYAALDLRVYHSFANRTAIMQLLTQEYTTHLQAVLPTKIPKSE